MTAAAMAVTLAVGPASTVAYAEKTSAGRKGVANKRNGLS